MEKVLQQLCAQDFAQIAHFANQITVISTGTTGKACAWSLFKKRMLAPPKASFTKIAHNGGTCWD